MITVNRIVQDDVVQKFIRDVIVALGARGDQKQAGGTKGRISYVNCK